MSILLPDVFGVLVVARRAWASFRLRSQETAMNCPWTEQTIVLVISLTIALFWEFLIEYFCNCPNKITKAVLALARKAPQMLSVKLAVRRKKKLEG
jgi:hypothetical protein